MKIYVDNDNNIKAINESSKPSLREIEIDRELVFKDFTDIEILNFKYIEQGNGYMRIPQIGYKKRIMDIQGFTDK
jgi:hypothetical protein